MRIGFCQYGPTRDLKHNLNTVERLLEGCQADLVVLPELAFSGYYFSHRHELDSTYDDDAHQTVLRRLTALAKRHAMTLVFGTIERNDDQRHNTTYVVDESGVLGTQRKITRTDNEGVFDPGDHLDVIDAGGVKLGIISCFDSWFPEAARVLMLKGAQLLCVPANFGGPWTKDVVKVRALENGVHAVLANRIGTEIIEGDAAEFRGESLVVNADGNVLIEASRESTLMSVDVDLSKNPKSSNVICRDLFGERAKFSRYVTYRTDT